MIGVNRRRMMGVVSEQYDENSYVQDGLIFQLDGIAKGNSADTSTWVDLKGGLVFTQEGIVESLADGWHFDGSCHFTCPTLLSGNVDYTVEMCASNTIKWHNGTWNEGHPYFYPTGKDNIYFLQRCSGIKFSNLSNILKNPFTASFNLSNGYINKIASTGFSNADSFSDPQRIDIGYYRGAHSTGTMYAIRIYNRRLTSEEQLNNQDIDIARFNISI